MTGASAPGLFTANQMGWGQAEAFNADSSRNTAENPASIGERISLVATAVTQTPPDGVSGSSAPPPTQPLLPLRVTVGGIPAEVASAGAAGRLPGLTLLNVRIPSNVEPGGYVPVVLQVADRTSSPAVWISVSGN